MTTKEINQKLFAQNKEINKLKSAVTLLLKTLKTQDIEVPSIHWADMGVEKEKEIKN